MKWATLFLCICLFACTQAELDLATDPVGQTGQGITRSVPTTTATSFTPPSVVVEAWPSATPLSWPEGATSVQVLVRTGELDAAGNVISFYAFIVADGARVAQAYRGRAPEFPRFRDGANVVFDAMATPGSNRSHGINGGIYTGPKIGGGPPGGDPLREIPGWYVARIIRTAGSIEDATLLTTGRTL
ncbi:MAG: hypothetical protein IPI49_04970 [Myxococcales bacterium]|jgi:hypothetical protein|nr:hypothetical protein [Myxococcales bacterium]